jgi:hemoglobin
VAIEVAMEYGPGPGVAVTAFELLGGADGVRRLVDRFYDVMETDPAARAVRALHPADLGESRRKLWMFLVGRLGGPPIYVEERGHPRLRARHLPFPIGADEAAQWMGCMDEALEAVVADDSLRSELRAFFAQVAEHMRNR